MFIIEYKKVQQCRIQELNPSFLFELHQDMSQMNINMTKMTWSASMGGLWGDFTIVFWTVEYL